MDRYFNSEEDFFQFLSQPFQFDKCGTCNGVVEVSIESINLYVCGRVLEFEDLPLLKCKHCGNLYLTQYAKKIIGGCYRQLKERNQNMVKSRYNGYRIKYNYCVEADFLYDHRDYESIPGLFIDYEHSTPGFLQPVYFKREALIAFVANPIYDVDIFSETYGKIAKFNNTNSVYKYEWIVPIGFNTNGRLVIWLGDIDTMDRTSQLLLKAYNIESDHLLIDSEFYKAQMNCIFSQPSIEKQIIQSKNRFITNIKKKYNIDLEHLNDQNREIENNLQRPVGYGTLELFQVINAFRRHLIEGIDVNGLRSLYELLYSASERTSGYEDFGTIKLTDKILTKLDPSASKTNIIGPLYVLNDYRTILDHSIGSGEEDLKQNIIDTLGVESFQNQEDIYLKEIEGLRRLYQLLALLTE